MVFFFNDPATTEIYTLSLHDALPIYIEPSNEFEVLGPAPPFISYVRGKYRKRFIIRCAKNKNIQKFVSIWLKKLQTPFDLKVSIDIDPYNFS